MVGKSDGMKITVIQKDMKLGRYQSAAEPRIMDALDVVAGEIQAHIRDGHPKVSNLTLKRTSGDRDALDTFRVRTGGEAGEFKGMLRWLTRTGATRNSVFIVKASARGSGFTRSISASVYSAQKHANDLEFGTVGKRAFPAFRPALIVKQPRGFFLMRQALLRTAAGL